MNVEPRTPLIARLLRRGWLDAWMCILFGLSLSIRGANAVAESIIESSRQHTFLSIDALAMGLIGDTVIHNWLYGSVLMLFGFAVGGVGLVVMIGRFRRQVREQ
jgi:hypothetical protein